MKDLIIYKTKRVKTPVRGTSHSVGLDFFVPEDLDYMKNEIKLFPGEDVKIMSGIKIKIPKNHCLIAFNKSGVAMKKNLIVGAAVIDEDYQGEISLHVINVGSLEQSIFPGEKLIQMILVPALYPKVHEIAIEEELFENLSERGSGGFGSTGDGLSKNLDRYYEHGI